jgi:hypothetical protein
VNHLDALAGFLVTGQRERHSSGRHHRRHGHRARHAGLPPAHDSLPAMFDGATNAAVGRKRVGVIQVVEHLPSSLS